MPTTRNRGGWLLRTPSPQARLRLFCFPYSGLGASMFNRWPTHAGAVEICPVQLPGRENRIREPHFGTFDALAEEVADGLDAWLDRPFGVFGHCGGALSAFAAALELRRRGGPEPACVFVSSQVAPHDGPYGRFLHMSDEQLRAELARLTVALGGQPRPDMLDLGLDVLRADIAANQRYRLPEPVRTGADVHAIGWRDDVEIRPEQMTGWRGYADDGRYHPVVLDGGHHSFLDAPVRLLDVVQRGLARAIRARGGEGNAP
jgi:surfactin synthase thioesterase subunit